MPCCNDATDCSFCSGPTYPANGRLWADDSGLACVCGTRTVTTEIAVLNRQAVALAADSVATIRSSEPGARSKPYPSATKIFELSARHPVGLMVYSAGDFLDVPWDTLVPMFRSDLAVRSFATLEEYRDALLAYLVTGRRFVSADAEHRWVAKVARAKFAEIRDLQRKETAKALIASASLSVADISAIGRRLIAESRERAAAAPELWDGAGGAVEEVAAAYTATLDAEAKAAFGAFADDDDFRADLRAFVAELLARRNRLAPGSGLVVAGYGEDDIFPRLLQLEVEGMVAGRVREWALRRHSVDTDDAGILSFGETEMVTTFLEGRHPEYERAVRAALAGMAEANLEVMHKLTRSSARRGPVKASVVDISRRAVADAVTGLGEFRAERFSNPILTTILRLPKNELASLAEALVSLTALSQRISDVPESVGGPVDVALISKGDGFIWIRRKQYFELANNPAYLERHNPRG